MTNLTFGAKEQARRIVRDLQSRFPALIGTKAAFQRQMRALLRKPFEPEFEILKFLEISGEQQMIDVGGNRGQSIDAVRLFQPDVQIDVFEANSWLADMLAKRFAPDENITIHHNGLGDDATQMTLFVPFYRNFMYDGLASVNFDSASSWLSPTSVANFDRNLLRIEERICEIKRLDSYDLDPAVIKIDVQGFEDQVLKGARETLKRSRPVLIVEVEKDVPTILTTLGYLEFGYAKSTIWPIHDGSERLSNSIFLQDSHVAQFSARGLSVEPTPR